MSVANADALGRPRRSVLTFGNTMTTLAKAFIELASYLKNASFDDPDEEQGAQELVEWCLIEASPEERDALSKVARERAREEAGNGSDPQIIEFYERFAARAESHQEYG